MKKILSIMLVLTMICSFGGAAFADNDSAPAASVEIAGTEVASFVEPGAEAVETEIIGAAEPETETPVTASTEVELYEEDNSPWVDVTVDGNIEIKQVDDKHGTPDEFVAVDAEIDVTKDARDSETVVDVEAEGISVTADNATGINAEISSDEYYVYERGHHSVKKVEKVDDADDNVIFVKADNILIFAADDGTGINAEIDVKDGEDNLIGINANDVIVYADTGDAVGISAVVVNGKQYNVKQEQGHFEGWKWVTNKISAVDDNGNTILIDIDGDLVVVGHEAVGIIASGSDNTKITVAGDVIVGDNVDEEDVNETEAAIKESKVTIAELEKTVSDNEKIVKTAEKDISNAENTMESAIGTVGYYAGWGYNRHYVSGNGLNKGEILRALGVEKVTANNIEDVLEIAQDKLDSKKTDKDTKQTLKKAVSLCNEYLAAVESKNEAIEKKNTAKQTILEAKNNIATEKDNLSKYNELLNYYKSADAVAILVDDGATVAVGGDVKVSGYNATTAIDLNGNGNTVVVEGAVVGNIEADKYTKNTVLVGELKPAEDSENPADLDKSLDNVTGFLVGLEDAAKNIVNYFKAFFRGDEENTADTTAATASGKNYYIAETSHGKDSIYLKLVSNNDYVTGLDLNGIDGITYDAENDVYVLKYFADGENGIRLGGLTNLKLRYTFPTIETYAARPYKYSKAIEYVKGSGELKVVVEFTGYGKAATAADFEGIVVKINGIKVDASNYTISVDASGNVNIIFTAEFLETLNVGENALNVIIHGYDYNTTLTLK